MNTKSKLWKELKNQHFLFSFDGKTQLIMKTLYKSAFALTFFLTFGLFAASCGEAPQSEGEKETEQTEQTQETEVNEAPADTAAAAEEHPSEHPSESEHPN